MRSFLAKGSDASLEKVRSKKVGLQFWHYTNWNHNNTANKPRNKTYSRIIASVQQQLFQNSSQTLALAARMPGLLFSQLRLAYVSLSSLK